jgi:hypothetical protein
MQLSIVLCSSERWYFNITVPPETTVLALKEMLYKVLVGRPHPAGQTLVHLGRVLENSETIGKICDVSGFMSECIAKFERMV